MGFTLGNCRRKNFFSVVKGFRVEPISFLNFIALGIFHLVSQIGQYQVICYHTIGDDPRFDCATAALGHGHGGHSGHRGHSLANETYRKYPEASNTDMDEFGDDFLDLERPQGPKPHEQRVFHGNEPSNWTHGFNESRQSKNMTRNHNGRQWNTNNSSLAIDSESEKLPSSGSRSGSGSFGSGSAGHNKHRAMGNSGSGSNAQPSVDQAEYKALETKLQKSAVKWQLIFNLCHTIPALFADTFLGALGDRHGRQVNILIGISGTIITVLAMTIMFTYPTAPLYILIISNLISGFTGFMSIIHISSFAYLADTVVDHEMLTVRMTYFSLIMSISGIISPQIGGALMAKLSNAQVAVVAQAILVGAFFLTLFIVKQRPPAIMRKIMLEKYIKHNGHPPPSGNEKFEKYHSKTETKNPTKKADPDPVKPKGAPKNKNFLDEIKSIFKSFCELWKEIYMTYTKPRPGHARMYLLFASFVYFLHITFEGGLRMSVFSLYVLKEPFNWGPKELSSYRSVNSALHLVGSMVGVVIFKKLLKLSDTTIILVSMLTHVIESYLFAFAKSTGGLYAAASVGCLSMLMAPCIKSFISQLVDPDEVGKSFTAFGIATTVAHLCSNLIYSGIYAATVGWFDGFAFLIAGSLEFICMLMIVWLHFDYHYDGSIKKWLSMYTNPCTRFMRRKPVAEANVAPAPATFSMNEKVQEAIKVESAEVACENL